MMKAPLSFVSVKIMPRSGLAIDDSKPVVGSTLRGWAMPQIIREDAIGDQFPDMADALVTRTLELLRRQLRLAESLVQLLGAAPRVPLRPEAGQDACDLVEVDAIRARVGASIRSELEPAARNYICDDRRYIADAVVVCGLADIECLIDDKLRRCFQC